MGDSVELDVTYMYLVFGKDKSGQDLLVPDRLAKRPYPEKVRKWTVNGIDGGDSSVGTVKMGANGKWVYQAPATVPPSNPVSVAGLIELSLGRGVAQLVSNIKVIPSGWSGSISVEFQAHFNNSQQLYTDASRKVETNYTNDSRPTYEAERLADIGKEIERLSFKADYPVEGAVADSVGDDGTGLAILRLAVPTVSFKYSRLERSGASLGCKTNLGNSTIIELDGLADLEAYQSTPPSPVTLNLHQDKASSIAAIPPALTLVSGRTMAFACDGKSMLEELGPSSESYGDTSSLHAGSIARGEHQSVRVRDPLGKPSIQVPSSSTEFSLNGVFQSQKGYLGLFKGDIEAPGVMTVFGRRVSGIYRIRWDVKGGK